MACFGPNVSPAPRASFCLSPSSACFRGVSYSFVNRDGVAWSFQRAYDRDKGRADASPVPSEPPPIAPDAPLAIYTAGYQALSIDGFLGLLQRAGVRHIIDVRHNPTARRFGFHRSTLARCAGEIGIGYTHLPALGIPGSWRNALDDSEGAREALFARYRREILPVATDARKQAGKLLQIRPSVLVCREANPAECHRSHLAAALAPALKMPICHL